VPGGPPHGPPGKPGGGAGAAPGGAPGAPPHHPAAPPDRFGLLGLLGVIRMTDPDLTTLALGTDLTTLGLHLNSPENVFKTFASPWADAPLRPEPDFKARAAPARPGPEQRGRRGKCLRRQRASKSLPESLYARGTARSMRPPAPATGSACAGRADSAGCGPAGAPAVLVRARRQRLRARRQPAALCPARLRKPRRSWPPRGPAWRPGGARPDARAPRPRPRRCRRAT